MEFYQTEPNLKVHPLLDPSASPANFKDEIVDHPQIQQFLTIFHQEEWAKVCQLLIQCGITRLQQSLRNPKIDVSSPEGQLQKLLLLKIKIADSIGFDLGDVKITPSLEVQEPSSSIVPNLPLDALANQGAPNCNLSQEQGQPDPGASGQQAGKPRRVDPIIEMEKGLAAYETSRPVHSTPLFQAVARQSSSVERKAQPKAKPSKANQAALPTTKKIVKPPKKKEQSPTAQDPQKYPFFAANASSRNMKELLRADQRIIDTEMKEVRKLEFEQMQRREMYRRSASPRFTRRRDREAAPLVQWRSPPKNETIMVRNLSKPQNVVLATSGKRERRALKPSSEWRTNESQESLERERKRMMHYQQEFMTHGVNPGWWGSSQDGSSEKKSKIPSSRYKPFDGDSEEKKFEDNGRTYQHQKVKSSAIRIEKDPREQMFADGSSSSDKRHMKGISHSSQLRNLPATASILSSSSASYAFTKNVKKYPCAKTGSKPGQSNIAMSYCDPPNSNEKQRNTGRHLSNANYEEPRPNSYLAKQHAKLKESEARRSQKQKQRRAKQVNLEQQVEEVRKENIAQYEEARLQAQRNQERNERQNVRVFNKDLPEEEGQVQQQEEREQMVKTFTRGGLSFVVDSSRKHDQTSRSKSRGDSHFPFGQEPFVNNTGRKKKNESIVEIGYDGKPIIRSKDKRAKHSIDLIKHKSQSKYRDVKPKYKDGPNRLLAARSQFEAYEKRSAMSEEEEEFDAEAQEREQVRREYQTEDLRRQRVQESEDNPREKTPSNQHPLSVRESPAHQDGQKTSTPGEAANTNDYNAELTSQRPPQSTSTRKGRRHTSSERRDYEIVIKSGKDIIRTTNPDEAQQKFLEDRQSQGSSIERQSKVKIDPGTNRYIAVHSNIETPHRQDKKHYDHQSSRRITNPNSGHQHRTSERGGRQPSMNDPPRLYGPQYAFDRYHEHFPSGVPGVAYHEPPRPSDGSERHKVTGRFSDQYQHVPEQEFLVAQPPEGAGNFDPGSFRHPGEPVPIPLFYPKAAGSSLINRESSILSQSQLALQEALRAQDGADYDHPGRYSGHYQYGVPYQYLPESSNRHSSHFNLQSSSNESRPNHGSCRDINYIESSYRSSNLNQNSIPPNEQPQILIVPPGGTVIMSQPSEGSDLADPGVRSNRQSDIPRISGGHKKEGSQSSSANVLYSRKMASTLTSKHRPNEQSLTTGSGFDRFANNNGFIPLDPHLQWASGSSKNMTGRWSQMHPPTDHSKSMSWKLSNSNYAEHLQSSIRGMQQIIEQKPELPEEDELEDYEEQPFDQTSNTYGKPSQEQKSSARTVEQPATSLFAKAEDRPYQSGDGEEGQAQMSGEQRSESDERASSVVMSSAKHSKAAGTDRQKRDENK